MSTTAELQEALLRAAGIDVAASVKGKGETVLLLSASDAAVCLRPGFTGRVITDLRTNRMYEILRRLKRKGAPGHRDTITVMVFETDAVSAANRAITRVAQKARDHEKRTQHCCGDECRSNGCRKAVWE